ncbi:MAG: hypothetical protein H6825_03430 [Planctomycetes bacterium]|nr:hypothetical protein [Planctomycetota bacterium]
MRRRGVVFGVVLATLATAWGCSRDEDRLAQARAWVASGEFLGLSADDVQARLGEPRMTLWTMVYDLGAQGFCDDRSFLTSMSGLPHRASLLVFLGRPGDVASTELDGVCRDAERGAPFDAATWSDGRDRVRMADALAASIEPGTSRADVVARLGEPDLELRRLSYELGVASSDPWGFSHWHFRLWCDAAWRVERTAVERE